MQYSCCGMLERVPNSRQQTLPGLSVLPACRIPCIPLLSSDPGPTTTQSNPGNCSMYLLAATYARHAMSVCCVRSNHGNINAARAKASVKLAGRFGVVECGWVWLGVVVTQSSLALLKPGPYDSSSTPRQHVCAFATYTVASCIAQADATPCCTTLCTALSKKYYCTIVSTRASRNGN